MDNATQQQSQITSSEVIEIIEQMKQDVRAVKQALVNIRGIISDLDSSNQ